MRRQTPKLPFLGKKIEQIPESVDSFVYDTKENKHDASATKMEKQNGRGRDLGGTTTSFYHGVLANARSWSRHTHAFTLGKVYPSWRR